MALICKKGALKGRLEGIQPSAGARFFRLAEVQKQLGVSRSTLWRWIAERGLFVIRVGGVTRIRESDLLAFLERHQSNPLPEPAPQGGEGVNGAPAR